MLLQAIRGRIKVNEIESHVLKRISVRYQAWSEWNEKANIYNKFDLTREGMVEVDLPSHVAPDVTKLKDLTTYPAVIPNKDATAILQVNKDQLNGLVSSNLIQRVGQNSVTKASLECFLGLRSKIDCPTIKNLIP